MDDFSATPVSEYELSLYEKSEDLEWDADTIDDGEVSEGLELEEVGERSHLDSQRQPSVLRLHNFEP